MKVYLNVPYEQKDSAKRKGARWDGSRKQWFVENAENLADFMRWMPKHLTQPHIPAAGKKRPAAGGNTR